MHLWRWLITSIIISFFFKIDTAGLISFYSMVLPFVFGLIIGIKSLMFVISKEDYKDEKKIKNNLNTIAEDIFKRLYFFFAISLMIFFLLVLHIDCNNILVKIVMSYEFVSNNVKLISCIFTQLFEIIICLSFSYFILILIDINTIITETINLNKVQNKVKK